MTKAKKPYQPIACATYDQYEIWAMRKTPIHISWMEEGKKKEVNTILIKTLSIKNGIEYLVLESGVEIRLDGIVEVGAS